MEKKYILNVGLNDKDTKLQKIDSIEAYKIVENTLLNNGLSGYTIYQGKGLIQTRKRRNNTRKHINN